MKPSFHLQPIEMPSSMPNLLPPEDGNVLRPPFPPLPCLAWLYMAAVAHGGWRPCLPRRASFMAATNRRSTRGLAFRQEKWGATNRHVAGEQIAAQNRNPNVCER